MFCACGACLSDRLEDGTLAWIGDEERHCTAPSGEEAEVCDLVRLLQAMCIPLSPTRTNVQPSDHRVDAAKLGP
eukprot:3488679-Amphidinium_carterae.1